LIAQAVALFLYSYSISKQLLSTYFKMALNLESSQLPTNIDQDAVPPYTHKAADLTLSSLHRPAMADRYTAVSDYTHFILILACLIGGIGSMPFVGLCNGGGSLAGTLSWVAGMGLVFHQYFKRGLLCQDEEQRFLWPPILGMICRHSKMGPELRANLRPPNANSKFTNPTSSDEPRCGYKWEG
jgi:hypothetical protein